VRFELDFDEADGVIKMQINGKDKGVVFTGEPLLLQPWACGNPADMQTPVRGRQSHAHNVAVMCAGLKGKALHPAIAFYSSGRTITALSVEGPISAPSAANVPTGASRWDPQAHRALSRGEN
jgi:hypothetical protein